MIFEYSMNKGELTIMFIITLALVMLALAVLERVLYKKENKTNNIIVFLRIGIFLLLFLISYFITDTSLGWLYVFFGFSLPVILTMTAESNYPDYIKYGIFILMPPLIVYLIFRCYENILIDFGFFMITVGVLNLIYYYPQKEDNTRKQNVAIGLGFVMAISFIFYYYNPYDEKADLLRKQEIVAKSFLEEELGLYGLEIYARPGYTNIRGRETNVVAFDSSGNINISMIYKNNRIISYEEEGIFDIIKKMV